MTPDLWQAVVLGAVQGATEFLPVSSSGHLVLVPALLGWDPAGLTYDTVVHWATALAVVLYYRADWARLLRAAASGTRAGAPWRDPEGRLLALLALGSLPAAVVGLAFKARFEALFDDPRRAALMLVVTGALLAVSERRGKRTGRAADLSVLAVLFIGVAQALAIAPGISRSGATIAAGLLMGLDRWEAARFSFLLATPVILGAGALQMAEFLSAAPPASAFPPLVAGFAVAAVAGYASIDWLLGYVRRAQLYVFAAYTCAAGLAAWWWLGP